MTRVGIGYDIHRLEIGEQLILGGVAIDAPLGAVGHSDADTLTHAVIDALLGACALGDIGEHFPPSDEKYRGISSLNLLAEVADMMRDRECIVVNVDAVVVLEEPKLSTYRLSMRKNLAQILDIDVDAVSIKAKTKEGIGDVGKGNAVEAHAVALVQSISNESEDLWV